MNKSMQHKFGFIKNLYVGYHPVAIFKQLSPQ